MQKRILLILMMIFVSGCATIFKGTKQEISVDSSVKDAEVVMDGIVLGVTPFKGKVTQKQNATITVRKAGYRPQVIAMKNKFPVAFWLNIFSAGTFGSTTDMMSGAAYQYAPNSFYATLEAEKTASLDRELRLFTLFNYDNIRIELAGSGDGEYTKGLLSFFGAAKIKRVELRKAMQRIALKAKTAPEFTNGIAEYYFSITRLNAGLPMLDSSHEAS